MCFTWVETCNWRDIAPEVAPASSGRGYIECGQNVFIGIWRGSLSMKIRDVIRILEAHGFQLDRQRGSHRQFEGMAAGKRRLVTVSGKASQDIKEGILRSIREQSGLPREAFRQGRAGK